MGVVLQTAKKAQPVLSAVFQAASKARWPETQPSHGSFTAAPKNVKPPSACSRSLGWRPENVGVIVLRSW